MLDYKYELSRLENELHECKCDIELERVKVFSLENLLNDNSLRKWHGNEIFQTEHCTPGESSSEQDWCLTYQKATPDLEAQGVTQQILSSELLKDVQQYEVKITQQAHHVKQQEQLISQQEQHIQQQEQHIQQQKQLILIQQQQIRELQQGKKQNSIPTIKECQAIPPPKTSQQHDSSPELLSVQQPPTLSDQWLGDYFQEVVSMLSQQGDKAGNCETEQFSLGLHSEQTLHKMEVAMEKIRQDKYDAYDNETSPANADKIRTLVRSLEEVLMGSFAELIRVREKMEVLGIE